MLTDPYVITVALASRNCFSAKSAKNLVLGGKTLGEAPARDADEVRWPDEPRRYGAIDCWLAQAAQSTAPHENSGMCTERPRNPLRPESIDDEHVGQIGVGFEVIGRAEAGNGPHGPEALYPVVIGAGHVFDQGLIDRSRAMCSWH